MAPNTLFIFILSALAVSAAPKGIEELCQPLSADKFSIFGTDETVTFDMATQTKARNYVFSFERVATKSDRQSSDLLQINQARTLTTSEGTHKVLVTKALNSEQVRLELQALQALSGEAFVPRFFGCQFDAQTQQVYIVQKDVSHLPSLQLVSNRRAFQKFPKADRLKLYKQLIYAIDRISAAELVHTHLESSSITYEMSTADGPQLLITDFRFVQALNEPVKFRGNSLYWSEAMQRTTHKVSAMDDLFAAGLFIVDMEYRGESDIFSEVTSHQVYMFTFGNPKHRSAYLNLAVQNLKDGGYGDACVEKVRDLSIKTLSALVVALLTHDSRFNDMEATVRIVDEVCQKELERDTLHVYERAIGDTPLNLYNDEQGRIVI